MLLFELDGLLEFVVEVVEERNVREAGGKATKAGELLPRRLVVKTMEMPMLILMLSMTDSNEQRRD